jgi:hypothetical protein
MHQHQELITKKQKSPEINVFHRLSPDFFYRQVSPNNYRKVKPDFFNPYNEV